LQSGIGPHAGTESRKRREIVNDEPEPRRVRLFRKSAGKPVNESDIAEVIHYPAQNVNQHDTDHIRIPKRNLAAI
jgi:hypothetical protein